MRGRALTDEDKDAILKAVGDAWKAQPAQRLGQLLANWLRDCWPDHLPSRPLGTLSFIEDGDLARNLGLWASTHPRAQPDGAARLGECSFCSGGMADYCTCPPEDDLPGACPNCGDPASGGLCDRCQALMQSPAMRQLLTTLASKDKP